MIVGANRVKAKRHQPRVIGGYLTRGQQELVDFYAAAREREKKAKKQAAQEQQKKENRHGGKEDWS